MPVAPSAPRVQQISLLDSQNRIDRSSNSQLRSMQIFNHLHGGEMRSLRNDTYLWLPAKSNLPPMVRWQQSMYIKE